MRAQLSGKRAIVPAAYFFDCPLCKFRLYLLYFNTTWIIFLFYLFDVRRIFIIQEIVYRKSLRYIHRKSIQYARLFRKSSTLGRQMPREASVNRCDYVFCFTFYTATIIPARGCALISLVACMFVDCSCTSHLRRFFSLIIVVLKRDFSFIEEELA